jgi:hypothetical protein
MTRAENCSQFDLRVLPRAARSRAGAARVVDARPTESEQPFDRRQRLGFGDENLPDVEKGPGTGLHMSAGTLHTC